MSDFQPQAERVATSGRGHESYDLNYKGVLTSTLLLAAVVVVAMVGLRFAMGEFARLHRREQARRPAILRDQRGQFPPPNLQPTPALDMARFHQGELARLNSYGWADARNRLAHIPIDRAMRLVVAKGLPTRTPSDAQAESKAGKPGK